MFQRFFKNKKILVTGHTGFQGTWLTLWLKLLGSDVIGISLKPHTKPSFFDNVKIKNEIDHYVTDVRKIDKIKEIISDTKPDFVFHLAAQAIVRESYKNPLDTFSTNIQGTLNVLDSLRESKVKGCIVYTSDKCYRHTKDNRNFVETDCLGGNDPYSASKASAEIVTESYRNSFFKEKNNTKIATVRAGNVIGGGDWGEDRLIPDFVRAIINKKQIQMRNPKHIRPWQYVLEPIAGILWLASQISKDEDLSQAWNFGPYLEQRDFTVKKLIDEFSKEWQLKKSIVKTTKNAKLFEEKYLKIDPSKADRILGVKSVYTIKDTISQTVAWYKNFIEKESSEKDFSIKQIKDFENNAKSKKLIWTNQ